MYPGLGVKGDNADGIVLIECFVELRSQDVAILEDNSVNLGTPYQPASLTALRRNFCRRYIILPCI